MASTLTLQPGSRHPGGTRALLPHQASALLLRARLKNLTGARPFGQLLEGETDGPSARIANITSVKDGLEKIYGWLTPFGPNRREAIGALEYIVPLADPRRLNPVTRHQAPPIPEPPSWLGNTMDGIRYGDLAGAMPIAVDFLKGEKTPDTCLRVVALMRSLPATPKELTDAINLLMEKYPDGMSSYEDHESDARKTFIVLAEKLTNTRSLTIAEFTEQGAFKFNAKAISALLLRYDVITDFTLETALIRLAQASGDISLIEPLRSLTGPLVELTSERTGGEAGLVAGKWQLLKDGCLPHTEMPYEPISLLRLSFEAIGTLLATELERNGTVEWPESRGLSARNLRAIRMRAEMGD